MNQQSEKKLLNSNISSTCPHNMANFGPPTAEIGSGVCGTPANFNRCRVLAVLLQRRRSTQANQTAHCTMFGRFLGVVHGMELRNFRRGRRLYSAGRPSRWALAHIS